MVIKQVLRKVASPYQKMHSPTACASCTMQNVTETLRNVTEALRDVTALFRSVRERYGALQKRYRSVAKRYGTLWERYGAVVELCGALRTRYIGVTEHRIALRSVVGRYGALQVVVERL